MDKKKTYFETMNDLRKAPNAHFDGIVNAILSGKYATRIEVGETEQLVVSLMVYCSTVGVQTDFLKKSVNLIWYIENKLKEDPNGNDYPGILKITCNAVSEKDVLVDIDFMPTPIGGT